MSKKIARCKTFQGKVYPADRERDPYLLLPFKVPAGVEQIAINYAYDEEKNILDLGVFDPRGCGFLTPEGFRGWSGSARRKVVIGKDWATPGYLPGPIYPGTWHVLLGLYQVSPRGCSYEVEVCIDPDDVDAPAEISAEGRYPSHFHQEKGWLKGDLHCHTYHSDAQGSVRDLVAAAEQKGLHFLAITDHNTVSHWREMEELGGKTGIILIPGEEVTTYLGHANVWGKGSWLDFRCRTSEQMAKVYEVATCEGRVFSINHPKPGGPPWEFGFDVPFHCIEVWHALWSMGNETSLELWDSLLRKGKRVVAVGGSDAHPQLIDDGMLFEWIGSPTTWVFAADSSPEGVLKGILGGHVSISACPQGPLLSLRLQIEGETFLQGMSCPPYSQAIVEVEIQEGAGLDLLLIGGTGVILREWVPISLWKRAVSVDMAREGFVRAELRVPVPGGRLPKGPLAALSNPVWCEDFLAGKIRCLRGGK